VHTYELVIIGGGPGGLTAGIYAARARLRTVLLEKGLAGGQVAFTNLIENYPGFPDGVAGMELGRLMEQQARNLDLEIVNEEALKVELHGADKLVQTAGNEYRAAALIIATGAQHTRLGLPSEEALTGRGVSYCAVCDGAFFRGREVAVVGGGDSAIDEGLFLTRFAHKVTIIHRRDALRATKILQERAFANPKMAFIWSHVVDQIVGTDHLEKLVLRHVRTGEKQDLVVDGLFIYIGLKPNTEFLRGTLKLDPQGCIVTNEKMETEILGIYAVGDVRLGSLRQAIIAAGEGATAALMAEKYLAERQRQI
jgi:thioredoxin reductase (NADPH)